MERTDGPLSGTRRFWTDNAALGLATVVAGLFNSAYSVLLAHALGPNDYGRIGALNNLVSLFLLPLPIVGLAAIRVGRQLGRQRFLVWSSLGLGVLIFVLAVVLSPMLARQFGLSPALIILYAFSVILNFGYALYIGFLKRARRYGVVGLLLVLASASAVLAVAVGVTLGHAHPLIWMGVLQGIFVVLMFFLTRWMAESVPTLPPAHLRPEVVTTTLGVGTLQALWGFSDVLAAKANLSVTDAGLYTGLSTIGQALPFFVGSLATVMLTAVLDEPRRRRAFLTRTLLATIGLSALFIGVLLAFPVPVVRLALGSAFVPMAPLVQRYSDAMAAMGLVLVLTTYGVAVGTYRTMVPAALGTIFWLAWIVSADSMTTLVNRTLVAMVATFIGVAVAFIAGRETTRSPH
ncbi:MAG: hypothetical protein M0Z36_05835 [Thermaerobacter sp.]|nr:hypothetical protein [Thermaerobacter sp.]